MQVCVYECVYSCVPECVSPCLGHTGHGSSRGLFLSFYLRRRWPSSDVWQVSVSEVLARGAVDAVGTPRIVCFNSKRSRITCDASFPTGSVCWPTPARSGIKIRIALPPLDRLPSRGLHTTKYGLWYKNINIVSLHIPHTLPVL